MPAINTVYGVIRYETGQVLFLTRKNEASFWFSLGYVIFKCTEVSK